MWASAYNLWADGISGDADPTNTTAMLEAFLTQQLRAYDWILMFNCTFFLGAVLHLFQPSYDWTCVMSAQTLVVFLCASVVHPSQLPSSVVEYDTTQVSRRLPNPPPHPSLPSRHPNLVRRSPLTPHPSTPPASPPLPRLPPLALRSTRRGSCIASSPSSPCSGSS